MPFLGKLPGVAPLELLDGSVTSQKIADLAIAAVDIADDAVTYSKIQNVSAGSRLLGRSASTNLALQSEDFTTWSKGSVTVTANAAVAPDGTTTMDRVAITAANNWHAVYRLLTVTTGTNYTYSVYMKDDGAGFGGMVFGTAQDYITVVVDLSSGLVTHTGVGSNSGTIIASGCEDAGNGIYRVWISGNVGTTQGFIVPFISDVAVPTLLTNGMPYFSGVTGEDILVWGAQAELGTYPTSYIPTTTTAVTNATAAGSIEEITPSAIRTMINVEDGANNYTHPSNHSISFIAGLQSALNLKADDTAISNIDNTSDANKPVSTATLTALNAKTDSTRVLTDVPSGAVFTDTVYTHPNHSGEVTSTADGATVIASNVVDEDNLKISNAGTNGQFLQKQSGNAGGLTWETVQGAYNAWAVKTTTYTAISGDQLIANHASTPFTISLPASPSTGDTVIIKNVGAALVTVAKNGAFTRINSVVEDATLPTGNASQLVYVNSTIGWATL